MPRASDAAQRPCQPTVTGIRTTIRVATLGTRTAHRPHLDSSHIQSGVGIVNWHVGVAAGLAFTPKAVLGRDRDGLQLGLEFLHESQVLVVPLRLLLAFHNVEELARHKVPALHIPRCHPLEATVLQPHPAASTVHPYPSTPSNGPLVMPPTTDPALCARKSHTASSAWPCSFCFFLNAALAWSARRATR